MLTEKEKEVLKLKKEGYTQLEISKKLKISQPAVSNFYNNALWKIKDAEETIKLAKELKLTKKLKINLKEEKR
jgi:transcriptional regulator